MPENKNVSWESEEGRAIPARNSPSSDRDPEFSSYEKACIKLTSFLVLGSGNAMPNIQLIDIIFPIYSTMSRVIMLVCTT